MRYLLLVLLLSGCATVSQHNALCESVQTLDDKVEIYQARNEQVIAVLKQVGVIKEVPLSSTTGE